VKTFAKANNLVSVFKFIVPLLVIGVLFTFFKPENFEVQGFAPFGLSGWKWPCRPAASSSPTWA
jgi:amino acid transporter